jgi:hypothetical protein
VSDLEKERVLRTKRASRWRKVIKPALNMVGLPTVFTHRGLPLPVKNALVGIPELTERVTADICRWNAPPELETTGFRAIPDEVHHNLPRAPTQDHP